MIVEAMEASFPRKDTDVERGSLSVGYYSLWNEKTGCAL